MSRIYLVRHGRAAAGWDDDPDPGLDDLGRDQAARTAAHLAELAPMTLVSSPLRRCRETAGFLAELWPGATVEIDERVSEIPSPDGVPLGQRLPWLRTAMAGSWKDLGERYTTFRDAVDLRLVASGGHRDLQPFHRHQCRRRSLFERRPPGHRQSGQCLG
ncbi:MAG: histidine phosphatase family protein, partial [Actinomycetota bacterium]